MLLTIAWGWCAILARCDIDWSKPGGRCSRTAQPPLALAVQLRATIARVLTE
jgi:hypothetical protein